MKQNFFGTDGIRNTIGKFPFELSTLPLLGKAIGKWALNKYNKSVSIILAHDTRISCSMVKSGLKSGLLLYGHTIFDAQILPTPVVCLLAKEQDFELGIVISASHNPYHDNGIKIITKNGKINSSDEETIQSTYIDLINSGDTDYSLLGEEIIYYGARFYHEYLYNFFPPDYLKGLKIVLDCANGATYQLAPEIFSKFGAQVITIHNMPDGKNINNECGSLAPFLLQKKVVETNADIGFAFDGDGDRVIACNKNGELKDGDDLLTLLLDYKAYAHSSCVVGTVMSNQGFENYLKEKNINFLRTKVGDKYVLETMHQNNSLLGGEPSGHLILKDYMNTGDGIFTALRVLQAIQQSNNWNLTTFSRYPQHIINLPVTNKIDLNKEPITKIIQKHTNDLSSGRIIVRYSGTENILRIMVENISLPEAKHVARQLAQSLQNEHTT